jgi:hypothetical protein
VPAKAIKMLTAKYIEFPTFAYRCCLKGFEKTEVNDNITTQFEIFCENLGQRKIFKMSVDDTIGNVYLVELDDESIDPPANVNRILLKNSRPLAETITLENAKRRQKDSNNKKETQDVREIKSPEKNNSRNNSSRGRRGNVRVISNSSNYESSDSKQRTHFGKKIINNNNNNLIAGTFYKPKEQSVWGSSDSNAKQNKTSDWNQAKNISRELNSDSDWNDTEKVSNKKSTKSNKNRRDNDSQSKQKARSEKNSNEKMSENNNNKTTKTTQKSENMKSGWVSTLHSVHEAYVHYEENVDDLEKILDQMFAYYENQNRKIFNIFFFK